MVLVHDTSSRRGLQVSLKNLQRFSSYRADTICDGQTDGQTDAWGKTICLPTLKWGDIKNKYFFLFFAQNIDCRYTLVPSRPGGSNDYPQSMFWSKNKKKDRYTPAYPSLAIEKWGSRGDT